MADGMTLTGRDELLAGIQRLPDHVTARLRGVAETTAARVLANAKANIAAGTKGQGNTARALQVTEDPANRQFVVHFGLILFRPSSLPLWLEYGWTMRNGQHHKGIYFMHDAAKAEDARYVREMEQAAVDGATEALG